jgi:hypothetical protein
MERNIELILSELGIDYQLYGSVKKTFGNVATIQQAKEEDLCYCFSIDMVIYIFDAYILKCI